MEGVGEFKVDNHFNKQEFFQKIKEDEKFKNKWGKQN